MKLLKTVVLAALLSANSFSSQAQKHPASFGRPTAKGIEMYVADHDLLGKQPIIKEFNEHFGVHNYEMWFEVDNLEYYTDSNPYGFFELGLYFEGQDYAVIDNRENFNSYTLDEFRINIIGLPPSYQNSLRGTLIHEMGHDFTKQVIDSLRANNHAVPRTYSQGRPTLYSEIIKEGIAVYCEVSMGEKVFRPRNYYRPKNLEEIADSAKHIRLKYEFGRSFVKPVLDSLGLEEGIVHLMLCEPPSKEELLGPDLFYERVYEQAKLKKEEAIQRREEKKNREPLKPRVEY